MYIDPTLVTALPRTHKKPWDRGGRPEAGEEGGQGGGEGGRPGGGEENLQARVVELEAAVAAEAAKVDLARESRREAENRAVTAQRAAEARVRAAEAQVEARMGAQLAQAQREVVAVEGRAAAAAAEQVATAVAGMAKARRAADTAERHAAAAVADAAQAREAVAAAEQQNRQLRKQIEQIRGEGKEDLAVAAELRRKYAMVGKPVRVKWGGGESYVGRITEFNEDDGKHMVIYTDGDVKWHDLDQKKWSEVSEAELKPRRVQRREY